jgi:hypothetical protein
VVTRKSKGKVTSSTSLVISDRERHERERKRGVRGRAFNEGRGLSIGIGCGPSCGESHKTLLYIHLTIHLFIFYI